MIIFWLVLSVALLVFAAVLVGMARPIHFPAGDRIVPGGFGLCMGLGAFLTLIKWAEVSMPLAGSMVILALLTGWFWPRRPEIEKRFKAPGMTPKAPPNK